MLASPGRFHTFCREGVRRWCTARVLDGPDNAELPGGAEGAVLRGCGRRCVHAATSSRQSRDEAQIRSSTEFETKWAFLPHF